MGHIQDVQSPAGGGFRGGGLSGVVGDVVAIDNVVVPVSLAWLKSCALKAESALPRAGF